MKQEEREFPVFVVMTTYIIILLMYLWTYKQGNPLFWGFFMIERLVSFSYEEKMDQYLGMVEGNKLKGSSVAMVFIFTLLTIGIFLYTPFKYPGLFWILLAGEAFDQVVKLIRKRLRNK